MLDFDATYIQVEPSAKPTRFRVGPVRASLMPGLPA
jgi:hypothetical protein